MLPLAQNPPPQALSDWLSVLAYVVGLILALAALWKILVPRPQQQELTNTPLEVKAYPGSVNREELKQVHGRIERERAEINRMIDAVKAESARRFDHLEEKLDANTSVTSELKGEVKHMNQTMTQLSASITNYLQSQAHK